MADRTLEDAMLRELERRFGGDRDPDQGHDDVVAIFRPSGEHIGAVTVLVDGQGFIVDIEGWSHAHFEANAPEDNVKAVAAYLDDLFADRIVLFRSPSGQLGGSFRHDTAPAFDGFPLPPPPGTEFTTWSSAIERPA